MRPRDPDMIMVGHSYTGPVHRALAKLRPQTRATLALDAFMSLLLAIREDTGELALTVQQLAHELGVEPAEVEQAMLDLARLRVVVRDPRRDGDAWFMNPHLAWCGSLQARARFGALVPPPAVAPRAR